MPGLMLSIWLKVLTDGQKLHNPLYRRGCCGRSIRQTTATDSKEATDATVNINTATVDMLMTLKGIGQTRAEDIIAYREKHGSFQNKEEYHECKMVSNREPMTNKR